MRHGCCEPFRLEQFMETICIRESGAALQLDALLDALVVIAREKRGKGRARRETKEWTFREIISLKQPFFVRPTQKRKCHRPQIAELAPSINAPASIECTPNSSRIPIPRMQFLAPPEPTKNSAAQSRADAGDFSADLQAVRSEAKVLSVQF